MVANCPRINSVVTRSAAQKMRPHHRAELYGYITDVILRNNHIRHDCGFGYFPIVSPMADL